MKQVLLFACMLLVMVSCKKEDETNPNENKLETANNPIVESIIKFDKQVKDYQNNTATRSSDTFTLEEAKDNIVNLFNAIYSEPMERYSHLVNDEFSITLAIDDNGNVSSNEAARAYLQMVEKARKGYKASNLSNKAYKYILVDEVNLTRGDSVTIDLKGRFGTKGDGSGLHHDGPFEEGDCWHYIDGMGGCDGNQSYTGGADRVLNDTIRSRYMSEWPCAPDEYRGIYVELMEVDFDGCDPSYRDYIFYRDDVYNTCICWQEMNDLLWGEYKVIYEMIPEANNFVLKVELNDLDDNQIYDHNYYVVDVTIEGNTPNDNENYITHKNTVTYGEYTNIYIHTPGQQPLD
ncbi:MAG: hypothetical protein IJZ87_04050 [Bacteroidales bacterium]|nr:hypothetical protein [Bacteroidales bacterium]